MKLIRSLLVFCVLAVPIFVVADEPVPISDLHQNDGMGVALLLDQVVTIQGIVTVPTGPFSTSRTDVYIQDETGGMAIFSYNPIATYNAGDEVRVTGTVLQYKGMTEVEPISVELISTGNAEPAPLLLTCADVRDSYDFDTNTEPNEARLVRINGVTWDPGDHSLTDGTGTAQMYIPSATGIPFPEGEFNVVGVVKQYDDAGAEGPFYLNYEVIPRYISDISYGSGPQFVSYPVQTDVAMGSATISWTTDTACETILEYGTSTNFEQEPIRLGDSTTDHVVTLSDLPSATVYYCRAVATDGMDSVTSPEIVIVSPAEHSSGDIEVYFSRSVDTNYSSGVHAAQTDISARMIEHINAATDSIDFCFANFTLDEVANALVAAHDRGVQVRVIYEVFDPVINILTVGGVEVKTDPDELHANTHNKYAVFDAQDADESNDYVWTGSWNATYSGTHFNAENAITIQDAALATAYRLEFEEMWGGTFSNHKTDNTPHLFIVGGRRVEQYMSPTDGLQEQITKIMNSADTDLLFSIYSFTDSVLSTPLIDRFNAGVAVRGVMDSEGADYEYSEYQTLVDAGLDIVRDNVGDGTQDELMHHKYLLADPLPGESDPTIVTGSYNWTYTAATYKDENIVIIHDPTITNIFFQEWMARYHEAGGTWDYDMPEFLQAAFSWDPASPAIGQEISFSDASTGSPTSWNWDFGDGSSSTDQNPTHSYTAAGNYTVTLEISDGTDTSSVSHDVSVSAEATCTPIWIAAAGSAAGAGGSQWATDLGVVNMGTQDLSYSFRFLPRGADNSTVEAGETMTLAANASVGYTDVWQTMTGNQDFGSIEVCVDNPSNAGVIARVYNSSDAGTFGQTIVGMQGSAAKMISSGDRVRLGFLSENSDYRTNVGFMNAGSSWITISAEFFTSDGTSLGTDSIDIAPYSSRQWNKAFRRVTTNAVDYGYVDVWSDTAGASFLAYGSVVDNGTGDPTTIWPFESSMAKDSAACTPIWIAAAGSAPGSGGSQWATDLGLTNLGADALTYYFQFLPRNTDNSAVAMSDAFTLAGNAAVGYTDVWQAMTGGQDFGSINVCVDNAASAGVIARVYNSGDAGTFGQTINGMTGSAAKLVGPGETARLGFLSQNAAFRTNIGFMNAGAAPITISVEFFNADGTSLGTDSIDIPAYSSNQWNKAFNRVTSDDVNFGYADVSSSTDGASFLTYGSVVDNATGDPTTIWPF